MKQNIFWHVLTIQHSFLYNFHSFYLTHFFSSGMDHYRPEVYEHGKRLLLHLLITLSCNNNLKAIASVLLQTHNINDIKTLTCKQSIQLDFLPNGKTMSWCHIHKHDALSSISPTCQSWLGFDFRCFVFILKHPGRGKHCFTQWKSKFLIRVGVWGMWCIKETQTREVIKGLDESILFCCLHPFAQYGIFCTRPDSSE